MDGNLYGQDAVGDEILEYICQENNPYGAALSR